MEGLHLLPELIQQRDWMIKMDLKDAYLQVPIHEAHQSSLPGKGNITNFSAYRLAVISTKGV